MDDNNGEVVWEQEEFDHPDDGVDFYIKLLRNPIGVRLLVLEPADTSAKFITKVYGSLTPHDAVLHDIDTLLQTYAR